MTTMTTTTTTTTEAHAAPENHSNYPENARLSLFATFSPEELLVKAMEHLCEEGIQLIEWHALLYRRLNVPIIAKNFSYIIPEAQLSLASSLLTNFGLPSSVPPPFLVKTSGDMYSLGTLHRLTGSETEGTVKYLALYPDSYISFRPEEIQKNTHTGYFTISGVSPELNNFFTPYPSAVFGAIIRKAATYPKNATSRKGLVAELGMLISYYLYPQHEEDDEETDAWDITCALAMIRGWDQEWRDGEEWIRDALMEVVKTGSVSDLPWSG